MKRYFSNGIAPALGLVAIILAWSGSCSASDAELSAAAEKPAVTITRSGDQFEARLIPRAKSSSITIGFKVTGPGTLTAVKAVDFTTVQRPEVDIKNFKSEAFELQANTIVPDTEIRISLESDFFSSSTRFYAFNPNLEPSWQDVQALNQSHDKTLRELSIDVRDGGPLDNDGSVNGRITLICGPRDSFWGYALGTLFIRFFGIFIVLSILMTGMILSGLFFKAMDKTPKDPADGNRDKTRDTLPGDLRAEDPGPEPDSTVPNGSELSMSTAGDYPGFEFPSRSARTQPMDEIAAVIALGVHLHLQGPAKRAGKGTVERQPDSAWPDSGRQRIMNERIRMFRRDNQH